MFAYHVNSVSDAYFNNPIFVPVFIIVYFHQLKKKWDGYHHILIAYGAPLHRFHPLYG